MTIEIRQQLLSKCGSHYPKYLLLTYLLEIKAYNFKYSLLPLHVHVVSTNLDKQCTYPLTLNTLNNN